MLKTQGHITKWDIQTICKMLCFSILYTIQILGTNLVQCNEDYGLLIVELTFIRSAQVLIVTTLNLNLYPPPIKIILQ